MRDDTIYQVAEYLDRKFGRLGITQRPHLFNIELESRGRLAEYMDETPGIIPPPLDIVSYGAVGLVGRHARNAGLPWTPSDAKELADAFQLEGDDWRMFLGMRIPDETIRQMVTCDLVVAVKGSIFTDGTLPTLRVVG